MTVQVTIKEQSIIAVEVIETVDDRKWFNRANSIITEKIDLWILDILLPVIFIASRSAEFDRVIGLEMGSDDYLAKPFLPRELILRVNRILNIEEKKQKKI